MLRWYCWLIFFTIAMFSTWALPAENEDGMTEGAVLDGEENDKALLEITDRYLRRKPNKNRYDEESSSSWDDDDDDSGKQSKIKCVCLGKKPFAYTLERYPPKPGNESNGRNRS